MTSWEFISVSELRPGDLILIDEHGGDKHLRMVISITPRDYLPITVTWLMVDKVFFGRIWSCVYAPVADFCVCVRGRE